MQRIGVTGALACLLLAGLAGCLATESGTVEYQTVVQGNTTGNDADGFTGLVLNNSNQWAAFWEQHESTRTPKSDPPVIAFGGWFVVAVLMGERSTGGYAINVTQVTGLGDEYTVTYVESEPCNDKGCVVTNALTSPYHFVSVERLGDGAPRVDWRPAAPS